MLDIALVAQVVVWLAVVGVFAASGQASVFHPSLWYLAFHGIVFVVRPWLVFHLGFHHVWDYMQFKPEEEDFIRTLGASSLGLVVFVTANWYTGRPRVQFSAKLAAPFSVLERRALVCTTLVMLPLVAGSIYATREGQDSIGQRAANGVLIMTHSTGYLNDAQFALAPLLCLWLVGTRFNWLNLIIIFAYVGYRSYYGWQRFTIILFFLMVILAFCWHKGWRWLPLWSLIVAIPLLVLFHFLGENRDMVKHYLKKENVEIARELRPGMSALEEIAVKYDTLDFANFDYLAAVVALVPRHTGTYNYGVQYAQLFTEPIPRILWKGKPAGAPFGLVNLYPYANWMGLTYSLVGDGWLTGGWIGVVIVMSIYGTLFGLGHRWFWANQNKPVAALIYVSGLAMVPQQYRDGGISIFKFLLYTWLPLLVWWGFIWLLGHARVPGATLLLRPGDTLRIIRPGDGRTPSSEIIRHF